MIKPSIGAVRATSYDLPPDSFVFGIRNAVDATGCAEVLHRWSSATPSKNPHEKAGIDFLKANAIAITKGHITAAAQRAHAKELLASHGAVGVRKKGAGKAPADSKAVLLDRPKVFGMRSVLDGEGVGELIEAKFTDFRSDKLYPDVSHRAARGRLPPPKATAASRGHDINTWAKPDPKKRFVPRRLRRIQSVLKDRI